MTLRNIILHPDPRLKKLCEPVEAFTADRAKLADDMLETMYAAPGIGIAAPQIGIMERMFVMDCEKDDDAVARPMVLINPQITWESDIRNVYEEGCLSIPDQFADVERPTQVEVTWQDVAGESHSAKFDGLWATCVQHEIDHLDGKLFIDYLKPLRRQMITRKMQKLKREMARG